jgi:hypothetical protein
VESTTNYDVCQWRLDQFPHGEALASKCPLDCLVVFTAFAIVVRELGRDPVPPLAPGMSQRTIMPPKMLRFWNDILFKMIKLTDLRKDRNDAPYSCPENWTPTLRRRVLKYLTITEGTVPQAIVFVRSKGIYRQIDQTDAFAYTVKQTKPDFEFIGVYFENTTQ